MEAAKAQVLFEIGLLTLGAAVLGIVVFGFLRRREAALGWHHHGNVWSAPFDRIDLAVAGLLALYLFGNVAIPALSPERVDEAASGVQEAGMSQLAIAIIGMVFFIALGCGVFAYASVLRRRDPVQLFGLNRLSLRKVIAWAAGSMVPVFLVVIALAEVWRRVLAPSWGGEQDLQEVVKLIRDDEDVMLRAALVFSAVVVAPLAEETIFRGFLYPVLKRYSDRFFAAVVTSLLFTIMHHSVPGILPLFGLALLLTAAYELTGCLWVPIAIHAAFNAVQSLIILGGNGG